MTKNKDLKLLLKKFAEDSTTHGIAPIQSSESKCSRVFSIAIFLFLFGCLTFCTFTSIQAFFKYDTVTSVTVQHYSKLEFPAVTICPNNDISKKYMPDEFKKLVDAKLMEVQSSRNYTDLHTFMKSIELPLKAAVDNQKLKAPIKPPWIFAYPNSCMFASKTPCNLSSDFKYVNKAFGSSGCYSFNSGDNTRYFQNGNGPLFGVSMTLYVNQSDYLPLGGNENGAGFTLYLHRADTPHNLMADGLLVAPGQITRVSLMKQETSLKPHPYPSNCSNGDGIKIHFAGQYSKSNCNASCAFDIVYRECGYANKVLREANKNIKYLNTTVEMLQCELSVLSRYQEMGWHCDCPVACNKDLFIPLVSTSRWPPEVDLPAIKYMSASAMGYDPENITDNVVSKSIARVSIFFEKLSVEKIIESPKTNEIKLISEIGGLLGLWIGSSLYSLVQAVALLFGVISIVLKRPPKTPATVTVNEANEANL